MDKKKGATTIKTDSDFEHLKVWKDNKNLDYYLSDGHWNFHVNQLLYKILQDFYREIYNGPAEVGAYLDHERDSFFEPTKDYSWQYGEMFNEAYRLCYFVLNASVPETKVSQVAEEASSLIFRNWKLPKGCLPPVPNTFDMILSYHILGMVNAILMWANNHTDATDRFLDALYRYNDTGVDYRKGALFEMRNHDFQFYHAVYLAQIVKQIIDATELRPKYDYSSRDMHLRNKFIWYKTYAENYEKMIPLPLIGSTNTERAQKYYRKAIEKGWLSVNRKGFRWRGITEKPNGKPNMSECAYFLGKVYEYVHSVEGNLGPVFPDELDGLFGTTKLFDRLVQVHRAMNPQQWRQTIDDLFRE